ncbi:MAG: hypothetical protein M3Q34_03085 [bacterium]|nr:hypothetical protein [bacterium]
MKIIISAWMIAYVVVIQSRHARRVMRVINFLLMLLQELIGIVLGSILVVILFFLILNL